MTSRRFVDAQPAARIVVGLSAGDGLDHGIFLIETLANRDVETHLVVSPAAARALGPDVDRVRALATQTYASDNQAARISSGSFLTLGMIVAPCDAGSVAAIVLGLATNLVYRAADVTLKEARPLVLGVPAAALARVPRDVLARAADVPRLELVPVDGSAEAAAAALVERLYVGAFAAA
jgi:4-hydroxy-3-polyprenylbenzoate decarboxylase